MLKKRNLFLLKKHGILKTKQKKRRQKAPVCFAMFNDRNNDQNTKKHFESTTLMKKASMY